MNTARSRTRKIPPESLPASPAVARKKTPSAAASEVSAAPVARVRKAAVKSAITDATAAKPARKTPARRSAKAVAAPAPAAKPARKTVATKAPMATERGARAKRPVAEPQLDERVREAVIARLDAMKANDMKVIDVRGKTSVTDCLVIVSGTSSRHVKSMGDEVVVTAKKHGIPPIGIEGQKDAEWMLVDLGDTVVHLFLPKTREFYGLERLWSLTEEARAHGAHA